MRTPALSFMYSHANVVIRVLLDWSVVGLLNPDFNPLSISSWIVIGMDCQLSIEKWIWIVNHTVLMDLDWIDNP